MKTFFVKPFFLGIVLVAALLAGCQNPIAPPEQAALPRGQGRVVVNLGAAAEGEAARTLGPAASAFVKYTLAFEPLSGQAAKAPVQITGGSSASVDLAAGNWTISVTGFATILGAQEPVAEGSAQLAISEGANEDVTILLAPLTGDVQGMFNYYLQLPDTSQATEFTITPLGGEAISIDVSWSTVGGQPATANSFKPLDPGEYLVRIRINFSTGKFMGITEVLHIYSGMTTELNHVFTDAEYRDTVTEFDLTSQVTAPVAWEPPATTISGNDQYVPQSSGSPGSQVAWVDIDNAPAPYIFLGNTVYKAIVTLAAKSDFTFLGVPENSFTYTGATSVVNAEDSGVVTITFPATENPSVTGVAIAPAGPTIAQGRKATFTATVTGSAENTPQAVTWTVSGNADPGTFIAADGVLTVALYETSASLTVTGTSIVDSGKSGTAAVAVTIMPTIEIDTVEKLGLIGADPSYPLSGKYKLTANVTLSNWTPIGSNTAPFAGIFDGNGKKITVQSFADVNLKGIFSCVIGSSADSWAALQNLEIESSSVSNTSGVAVGLLAAYAENAEIRGITLSGSLTHTAETYVTVGGIVGYLRGGILADCAGSLNMTVTGKNKTAQLFASPPRATSINLASYAGGFVGYSMGGIADIIDCSNTGNVAGTSTSATNIFCGGIAGYISTPVSPPKIAGQVAGCSSTGTISASSPLTGSTGGKAGGIVGEAIQTLITGCRAVGTVSASGANNVYAGGIAGAIRGVITQSYFNGTVEGSGNASGELVVVAGGIAGSGNGISGIAQITDCWSHGQVAGGYYAGGIMGYIPYYANSFIDRCYSTAAVNATNPTGTVNAGVGGIAGDNRSQLENSGITNSVALNPTISSSGDPSVVHRVLGNHGDGKGIGGNYAWSGMTVTLTNATFTADPGADKLDGADLASGELNQAFYEGLGWDFAAGSGVWAMDTYGYPKLQWQQTELARAPLGN